MKYTAPNYEAIQTKDVITTSTAFKVNGVTVGSIAVVDDPVSGEKVQRFLIPDVSILL